MHAHIATLLKYQPPEYPPLLSLIVNLVSFPKFGEITLKVSALKKGTKKGTTDYN